MTARPPAVDIAHADAGLILTADLPGVAADGLELRVEGHTLTLSAAPAPPAPDDAVVRHAEFAAGPFHRSFILDAAVDHDAIAADLTDGVLRVTLPRRDAPGPRTVAVTAE